MWKEQDPSLLCEEWWEATDPANNCMGKLPVFFKDEDLRKQIEISQKLEILGVSLIQFLMVDIEQKLHVPMKNLIFYTHQSILLQMKLLLDRLPED